MGSTVTSLAQETSEQAIAKRASLKQAQESYRSRSRFGQTSTRRGGLTAEQIGPPPAGYSPRSGGFGFGSAGSNATLG